MNPNIVEGLSHADYLAADGFVSSSMLKGYLPEHFRPFNGSPSADIGSVLHGRFTGDDTPLTVVDAATWTGKAAKETREQVVASGGYAILSGDVAAIDGMEAALRAHGQASELLVQSQGSWEVSVFADVDDVPSKARFDRLLDAGIAVDVKTTRSGPGEYALSRSVLEFGYEIQQVHYTEVARSAGIELEAFYFLFVQNIAPYHVTVVELEDDFLERGRVLRDLALQRWLHPAMVDAYPGESGRLSLSLPRWAIL